MHLLAIPCIIMASINFYVAAYYLFFYLKKPQIREHLPFALLCLSVGLYDVFCVGLYNSLSVDQGIFWQKLQFHSIAAISIFLIWFTSIFTKQKNNRIIRLFIAWFIIVFIVSFMVTPEISLSSASPAVKNIELFGLPRITYHEGALGIFYQVEIMSSIIAYLFLFYLFIGYYRKSGERILFFILFSQVIYFFSVINDSLVGMQFYSFIYVSEYAFFFVIIAMACALLNKFVNLHTEFEALNAGLEQKIYERTCEILAAQAQVKRLEGIIPICMYCKKMRDDKESWHQLEQYITEHSEALFSHGICPECRDKWQSDME